MDMDSGRVLYESNINEKHLIASTTKIMTALVTLNNIDINREIVVGDEVLKAYGSAIYIKPNEKLRIKDLLYGLMLRSGNDAALVLAKNVGGSIDGFVKLMNETAYNIGMNNTTFNNPSGLDEESKNISTTYDMALLMREAMKNKTFRKITSTKKYFLKTNFNTYSWYNKNKLLSMYEYATGGKIGYTKKARHTFVSAASKNGKNLIVATFDDDDMFNNHKYLYEKYFKMYKKYRLIDRDKLYIKYKKGTKTFTMENYDMLLKNNDKKYLERIVSLYDNVSCFNTCIIGKVSIKLKGKTYKEMNLYSNKAKNKEGIFEKIFKKINKSTKN